MAGVSFNYEHEKKGGCFKPLHPHLPLLGNIQLDDGSRLHSQKKGQSHLAQLGDRIWLGAPTDGHLVRIIGEGYCWEYTTSAVDAATENIVVDFTFAGVGAVRAPVYCEARIVQTHDNEDVMINSRHAGAILVTSGGGIQQATEITSGADGHSWAWSATDDTITLTSTFSDADVDGVTIHVKLSCLSSLLSVSDVEVTIA